MSFADIYILRNNGKSALVHDTDPVDENWLAESQNAKASENNDVLWSFEFLTDYEYDALFMLPHIFNKSYYVGFVDGKCRLIRVSMVYPKYFDGGIVCCRNITDIENDAIMWKSFGDDTLLLCIGDLMRTYCTRTRTFSDWYRTIF